MAKDVNAEFKTLLTRQEYERIYKKFKEKEGNVQTNYYFDTKRFTLKASEAQLRVKEKDDLTLVLERKKGYNNIRIDEAITKEQFQDLMDKGIIPSEKINLEIADIIKDQPIRNFMSLSTYRISFPYKKGKIALDKCTYVNTTDYELEYQANSQDGGKHEFVEILGELNISYKKSQVKLKRAYDALRKVL